MSAAQKSLFFCWTVIEEGPGDYIISDKKI